nr:MAG TPA: hypothetical protein [Caudoviricetes sp.]
MESVIASLVTGVLTLVGVLASNAKTPSGDGAENRGLDQAGREAQLPHRAHVQPGTGHGGGPERHRDAEEGGQVMELFLTSNEWQWRLLRTVVLGVVVANLDMLVGCAVLEPVWRAVVVALVMAVLSPVMAELGAAEVEKEGE